MNRRVAIPSHTRNTHSKTALFLFGRPGAGKSVLANYLAQQAGYFRIGIGALLRELAESQSSTIDAQIARWTIQRGCGAPNSLVFKLIASRYGKSAEMGPKLLFDGYPMEFHQVHDLDQRLLSLSVTPQHIRGVFLDIDDQIALRRLEDRRLCSQCGTPKTESGPQCCPNCGGDFERRIDDTIEIWQNRLSIFNESALPVINLFGSLFPLLCVNADQSQEQISDTVQEWLHSNKIS